MRIALTLGLPLPSDHAAEYHVQGVQPQTEGWRVPAADARAVVGEGRAQAAVHKGVTEGRSRAGRFLVLLAEQD